MQFEKEEYYLIDEKDSRVENSIIGNKSLTMEVISQIGLYDKKIQKGRVLWMLKCDKCGHEKFLSTQSVNDGTYCDACGKRKNELNLKIRKPDGSFVREYSIWMGIKQRCNDVNYHSYSNYGGRGVKVCDEWLKSFESFYAWSHENGYDDTLSIDRIDVNGLYEPSNCRWATAKEQANNRTNNRIVVYNDKEYTMSQLGEILGLSHEALGYRVDNNLQLDSTKRKYTKLLIFDSSIGKDITLSDFCKKNNIKYSVVKYYFLKNKELPNIDIVLLDKYVK